MFERIPLDYRCSRRTNDAAGWVALGFTTVMFVTFLVLFVTSEGEQGDACLSVCLAPVFAAPALFSLWQVVRPHGLEVVVEAGVIRWGRTDQPDRQTRIRLAEIKRWLLYRTDQELVADTGCIVSKPIGQFILSIRDIDTLLAFLVERHANVCVVDVEKASRESSTAIK